jgi:hypothetical protein
MFEATKDFFADALNHSLEDLRMLDIMLTLTGLDDHLPLGVAIYEFHKLAPRERNYICCVLIERDQDPKAWQAVWDIMELEAFE